MRIRSWTSAPGGCGFYRVRRPFEELARHGHTCTVPDVEAPPDVEDVSDADVVVCQRLASEPLYAYWRWVRAVTGTPMVYELDDDIWSIDVDNPPLMGYLHPQVGEWAEQFIGRADLVTASTERLACVITERTNRNVVVLPNRIDGAVFDLPRVVPREDGRVTAGWTCSTSHVTDLRSVLGPWRDLFGDSRWKMDLRFVGVDYREMLGIGTDAVGVFLTPWREDVLEYYAGIDFDIGLAPLAPIEFNRGKSPNKVLEYMARGIPVVASDFGPYRGFVEHGVTGFLVRSPDEWGKYVGVLADDPQMRAQMGAAGLEVARRHTIQEWWPAWEAAYRSVL